MDTSAIGPRLRWTSFNFGVMYEPKYFQVTEWKTITLKSVSRAAPAARFQANGRVSQRRQMRRSH